LAALRASLASIGSQVNPSPSVVDPAQEVGDAPDALVHERHLEHDVVTVGQHVADTVDPLLERLVVRLVPIRDLEHRQPLGPIPLEHRPLVLEPLVEQHLRHLAERARLDRANARLDLVLQREEVRAVEPRCDLRRGEESFRHGFSVTDGCRSDAMANSVTPPRACWCHRLPPHATSTTDRRQQHVPPAEESPMNAEHPTPLCGPVPDGLMRLTFDMPQEMFDELRLASLRRGVPLDRMIITALCLAATAP
jgi:hypothetical protein